MDYYKILGLDRSASADDIKKAYRKQAMKHHPDRGGDESQFTVLQEAYDVLGNPNKRAMYDAGGRGSRQNFDPDAFSHAFNNIFDQGPVHDIFDFFGNRRQQRAQPRRNRDMKITVEIPLTELTETQTKTIRVQTSKGSDTEVEIQIPAGIQNNVRVKYPGLVDNFFDTIPRGDLYVYIRHQNTKDFAKLTEVDVMTRVYCDLTTAITGGKVQVAGLDGPTYNITVPAGTQSKTKFNIPNKGLWQNTNCNNRGNLIVELNINIPNINNKIEIENLKKALNVST